MTWKDAKTAGKERAAIMLARIRAAGELGQTVEGVRLVDYETEEDYDFLNPGDPWSHGFHKMVIRSAARELRKAGYRVRRRALNMKDYFEWLAREGRKDGRDSRALFINLP